MSNRNRAWVRISRGAIVVAAFAILLAPNFARAESRQWEGPYFFIQMSDPQLGMKTENADFEYEEAQFRRAIAEANRLGPEFVMICGDLVNKVGGEEQIEAFFRIIKDFDGTYPVHWASGNHDVSGAPTPELVENYRQRFGPDAFTFDRGCCRYIVINSSIIAAPRNVVPQVATQLTWFEQQLKQAKADGTNHIFLVQHHPWFLETAEEPYVFYKTIRVDNRAPYIKLMREYEVSACFAGHTHSNELGSDGEMEMITTSSIGPSSTEGLGSGFRIVKVYKDRLEHEFYELDDLPERVELSPDVGTEHE